MGPVLLSQALHCRQREEVCAPHSRRNAPLNLGVQRWWMKLLPRESQRDGYGILPDQHQARLSTSARRSRPCVAGRLKNHQPHSCGSSQGCQILVG